MATSGPRPIKPSTTDFAPSARRGRRRDGEPAVSVSRSRRAVSLAPWLREKLLMAAFIALLRAINVGGTGKLPMRELKQACEAAGLKQVSTYIASGNIVFVSE